MVPTTRPLVRTEDRSSGLSRSGRRRRRQLGEAEVQHLDESVRPAYHVLGLEIAVHDTCGVRSAQGSSDLQGEIERLAPPDGPSCQALSQRFALHELHRDKLLAVGCFAECVNRADVRMVQSGGGARLLLEAGDAGRVLRQIGRKNLEPTCRSSLRSRASHTSPMPPLPRRATISNASSRDPGPTAIRLREYNRRVRCRGGQWPASAPHRVAPVRVRWRSPITPSRARQAVFVAVVLLLSAIPVAARADLTLSNEQIRQVLLSPKVIKHREGWSSLAKAWSRSAPIAPDGRSSIHET
jgi:hypothetical protein